MAIDQWVRLPSAWIDDHGLTNLAWKSGGEGADNIAVLMALTAIAHAADQETGIASLTYDALSDSTGLSRAKLSNGLEILKHIQVIGPAPEAARSTYQLINFGAGHHWAKMPAKSMYSLGRITAFADFKLRKVAELDALKLFLLFVARRGGDTNFANIGYEKIEEYTGIRRVRIKAAISILALVPLVYVEQLPSKTNPNGYSNAYRIVGIDPYNHRGTRGRETNESDAPISYADVLR
jgi:hypothetical protein